jgi:hypothetical protein
VKEAFLEGLRTARALAPLVAGPAPLIPDIDAPLPEELKPTDPDEEVSIDD